jgi:hypothetical protein
MAEKIDYYEIQELAGVMCDMVLEDEGEKAVEEALCEKFQVDFDMLHQIMEKVTPLIDAAVSPLSNEPLIGIGDGCVWIWKKKHEKFINMVLEWMDAISVGRGKNKGFQRIITKKGTPEFKLILTTADTDVDLKKAKPATENPEYLLWNGQYVGNSLLFWREGKAGYTTDISKAHRFTFEEASKIQETSDRQSKLIPLDHCQEVATLQVHADHLDRNLIGKEATNG